MEALIRRSSSSRRFDMEPLNLGSPAISPSFVAEPSFAVNRGEIICATYEDSRAASVEDPESSIIYI